MLKRPVVFGHPRREQFELLNIFIEHIVTCARTHKGHHKCREQWPPETPYERIFNIALVLLLLALPLFLMCTTYKLITDTLWQGIVAEQMTRQLAAAPVLKAEKHGRSKHTRPHNLNRIESDLQGAIDFVTNTHTHAQSQIRRLCGHTVTSADVRPCSTDSTTTTTTTIITTTTITRTWAFREPR